MRITAIRNRLQEFNQESFIIDLAKSPGASELQKGRFPSQFRDVGDQELRPIRRMRRKEKKAN